MNVSCPSCNTVFRVDPAKVPEGGVRARCSVCRAVFRVSREVMPDRAAPAPAPAPSPPAPQPPPAAQPVSTPEAGPAPGYRAPTPTPAAAPPEPRPFSPGAPATPPAAPHSPVMPAAPAAPAAQAPPPAQMPSRGPAPPVSAPVSTRPVMPPTGASASAAAPAPRPATGAPVNPFLSQDPNQKARRLARALVSDLVVYHPDKRQQGLRDGTLKELFEDEIKKSWEEYTEQIGSDVADAASYFNDALNDILSDGRKMF